MNKEYLTYRNVLRITPRKLPYPMNFSSARINTDETGINVPRLFFAPNSFGQLVHTEEYKEDENKERIYKFQLIIYDPTKVNFPPKTPDHHHVIVASLEHCQSFSIDQLTSLYPTQYYDYNFI